MLLRPPVLTYFLHALELLERASLLAPGASAASNVFSTQASDAVVLHGRALVEKSRSYGTEQRITRVGRSLGGRIPEDFSGRIYDSAKYDSANNVWRARAGRFELNIQFDDPENALYNHFVSGVPNILSMMRSHRFFAEIDFEFIWSDDREVFARGTLVRGAGADSNTRSGVNTGSGSNTANGANTATGASRGFGWREMFSWGI
ncbi:MAG: hypothetical protein M1833_003202 [Piccolia ochrophora]|nr:MAG: hypothetical protein M1833_003202 [Piccolia ochrophora]